MCCYKRNTKKIVVFFLQGRSDIHIREVITSMASDTELRKFGHLDFLQSRKKTTNF